MCLCRVSRFPQWQAMSTTLLASGTAVLGRTKNQERLGENDERMRLRILESKFRAIGIDKDALDAQLEEHEMKRGAEEAEDKRYAEALSEAVARAEAVAAEEEMERASAHAALRAHWRMQADQSGRPEWDITDPDGNKKALPPRTETDVSRVGPSSIQVFESEFSESPDAQRRRARDVERANHELAKARREAAARAAEEERKEALMQAELLGSMASREMGESTTSLRGTLTVKDENKRLAMERKARLREEREYDLAKEREHLATMGAHPLLTEHRSQSYSAVEGRKRRDHYKGMSKEELAAIREEQARQRAAKEAERARERDATLEHADIWGGGAAVAAELERTAALEELDARTLLDRENKALRREQRLRRKATKDEYDGAFQWEGSILDGFNKRGR